MFNVVKGTPFEIYLQDKDNPSETYSIPIATGILRLFKEANKNTVTIYIKTIVTEKSIKKNVIWNFDAFDYNKDSDITGEFDDIIEIHYSKEGYSLKYRDSDKQFEPIAYFLKNDKRYRNLNPYFIRKVFYDKKNVDAIFNFDHDNYDGNIFDFISLEVPFNSLFEKEEENKNGITMGTINRKNETVKEDKKEKDNQKNSNEINHEINYKEEYEVLRSKFYVLVDLLESISGRLYSADKKIREIQKQLGLNLRKK